MVVECLECGSPEVILTAKVDVDFQFDEKGDIALISNVADDVYYGVEYEEVKTICKCPECGHQFSYDEWRESLKEVS